MSGTIERGNELLKQAEGKLKSVWPFTSPKWDDASELFQSAAAQFKAAKAWMDAGNAQMRAGDCFMKKNEKYSYCTALLEAANCFKRVPTDEARRLKAHCFSGAIDGFVDQGKFTQAAKATKDLAQEEEEAGSFDKAITLYKRASDFYHSENRSVESAQCMQKVASLTAAALKDYKTAAQLFERVATAMLDTPLGKYQAKDLLFKAGLCRFASCAGENRDEALSDAKGAVDRYGVLDPHFGRSNEEQLLVAVGNAFEQADPDAVSDASADYNAIKAIDDWTAELLLAIRTAVGAEPSIL